MNSKYALILAGLCAASVLTFSHAQTAGSASPGAPAGGATANSAGTSTSTSTSTTPSTQSPNLVNTNDPTGAASTSFDPNASPTANAAAAGNGPVAPVGTLTNTTVGASSAPTFGAGTNNAHPATGVNGSGANASGSTAGGVVSPGTRPIGPRPLISAENRPAAPGATPQLSVPDPTGVETAPRDAANVASGLLAPVNSTGVPPSRITVHTANNLPAPVAVSTPPPAGTPELVPASPGPNHTWIRGHHVWNNGQWTWVNGAWATAPQPGAVWVDGRYDSQSQRWIPGHWESSPQPTR